jgi:hypothetical protein
MASPLVKKTMDIILVLCISHLQGGIKITL